MQLNELIHLWKKVTVNNTPKACHDFLCPKRRKQSGADVESLKTPMNAVLTASVAYNEVIDIIPAKIFDS